MGRSIAQRSPNFPLGLLPPRPFHGLQATGPTWSPHVPRGIGPQPAFIFVHLLRGALPHTPWTGHAPISTISASHPTKSDGTLLSRHRFARRPVHERKKLAKSRSPARCDEAWKKKGREKVENSILQRGARVSRGEGGEERSIKKKNTSVTMITYVKVAGRHRSMLLRTCNRNRNGKLLFKKQKEEENRTRVSVTAVAFFLCLSIQEPQIHIYI